MPALPKSAWHQVSQMAVFFFLEEHLLPTPVVLLYPSGTLLSFIPGLQLSRLTTSNVGSPLITGVQPLNHRMHRWDWLIITLEAE